MNKTNIEYLDYTWNPTHGCSKISSGCAHCWASDMAKRLAGMGVKGYSMDDPFKVVCSPEKLDEPLRIKKPSVIGVSFMGDLFHEDVPWNFRYKVFETILLNHQHIFIILTKRPENMRKNMNSISFHLERNYGKDSEIIMKHGFNNLWLGVSISTQKDADDLIPVLLNTPAAVRFVSVEPMLEYIDFAPQWMDKHRYFETGTLDGIICGAESGPGCRPFKYEWAWNLLEQCQDAHTPFFYKQGIDDSGKWCKMPRLQNIVWDQLPNKPL